MVATAGYILKSKNQNAITDMIATLSSFKGGKEEIFQSDCCALGQKQLSKKFDISPIEFESCKGFYILFSGKIFNTDELKNDLEISKENITESELILLSYCKHGKNAFSMLKGSFAIAIWNDEKKELVLSRDGCGVRPMYYYFDGESFVFASRLRAFEKMGSFKKEFNERLLSAYLCFNHIPAEETFFKNVFRLEPGHILTYKNQTIGKECFFRLSFNEENKELDSFANEIHSLASKSIIEQTEGTNFATFLSGGVDSSYMASVAMPKATYTVGYANQKYDETVHSRELAEKLGIENKVKLITPEEYLSEFETIVRFMDEPLADPSAAALYFGAREASKDVDIILSGEGADELFGGYNSYKEELTHKGFMKLPYFIRHLAYLATKWIPGGDRFGLDFFYRRGQNLEDFHIGLDRIFKDSEANKLIKSKEQVSTKDITKPFYDTYKNCSTLKQRQAIDFYFWLINDFVHSVTRCADDFGIQARFPLLGKDIVDIATTLPDKYKISLDTTKIAFRLAAKKAVPTDAHSRKKLGFPVPLKEWIKQDDFYNEIRSKFESDISKKFFDVDMLIKLLDDHRNGKRDCYKKVWTVYTFIVWYNIYFEN